TLKTAIWGGNGWRGTGWRAAVELKRHDIAGKTGTTNEARDLWFSGFTPGMVATAWIGFDNHQRSLGAGGCGGNTAQPSWIDCMKVALRGRPEQEYIKPADIVSRSVDN
ncbi:penicillin-sensitive transpeptidase, partial [Aeromonas veronii]